MQSPSNDIKDMLVADSSLGLIYANNLFIGKEPAKPRSCVTIYDTTGYPPSLTLDKQFYQKPSIQIRVRNEDYLEGMDLAQEILLSLHSRAGETWNESLYTIIYCTSGPALLDWDDNNNPRFFINFEIQRR